jgi:hypothetical protein
MKFLIEIRLPTTIANEKLKSGQLLKELPSFLKEANPEMLYYGISGGKRSQFMVVDIKSPEKIPEIIEPFWLTMEAEIYLTPVMGQDEFQKAGDGIQRILKKIP